MITTAVVNCGPCQACCKVPCCIPDEEAPAYRIGKERAWGLPTLERKPNGDCIYLGVEGCEIYEVRPSTCREFSCEIVLTLPENELEKIRKSENRFFTRDILEAAEERFKK